MAWTTDQVLALAPDDTSKKAGQSLASPRKWVSGSLGKSERAAWGECQGSGSKPYQTQIDLSEPAFKCSCPSRKFPCKHGLGLFLILAAQPDHFTEGEPPTWVSDWLDSRAARSEKQAKKETTATEPPDPAAQAKRNAAQAKREAARTAKVTAGLQELELWMQDLIRRGLVAVQGQPYTFWDTPAARMIDAQAPGLARQLRDMAGIPASGSGWPERLLDRLGRLHLLIESYQRLATLPEPVQADVRSLIGWTLKQEDLHSIPGVQGRWRVIGQRVNDEERVRVQRTWVQGQETGRFGLLLSFAAFGQQLDTSTIPGTMFEAELVYYPGNYPLRAALRSRDAQLHPVDSLRGFPSIPEMLDAYADALSRNPWLEHIPVVLEQVVPLQHEERWIVRDSNGLTVPLAPRFQQYWQLMALSGGHPIALAGEWDGELFLPLGAYAEGRFTAFTMYS